MFSSQLQLSLVISVVIFLIARTTKKHIKGLTSMFSHLSQKQFQAETLSIKNIKIHKSKGNHVPIPPLNVMFFFLNSQTLEH
jgi:hypothetical protein